MTVIRIHIDGASVDIEAGSNLLTALLEAGYALPHPCFHPALSAPASCRMCLVALEGPSGPRLITTCNRSVDDGQRLRLRDPQVQSARSALVDDLLLRHPAECAVCERAGECEVQETVFAHGDGTTRATLTGSGERVQLGPRLVLDRGRCILCTRCVRFEAEISGGDGLAVSGAGADAVVDTCGAGPVEHELTGNLLDICPAGALSEPGERFRPPAWRMTGVSSVCPGCASGCATRIDVAHGRVQRVKPRADGDDAQGYWLCDAGRYGWHTEHERLTTPQLQGEVVEWDAALAEVAEQMEQATGATVLLSPYLSNEEAFLLANLAQRWKADLFLWQTHEAGGDRTFPSGFTIRAQRGPNVAGVTAVAAAVGLPLGDTRALSARLAAGEVDALYALGGSLHGEGPDLSMAHDLFFARQDVLASSWTRTADVSLAGASAWTEKEGTFVDGLGRLQRVRAAVAPPGEARPDFWILAALWHGGPNRDSPDQAFSRLARSSTTGPFARTDYDVLESRSRPAVGVAFGGGWTSHLQRRGLIPVEDHAKRR
jgi:NADH-quinone oxidoreductase subunit G